MLSKGYYLFVEVAAQRCSQLMRGAKPKIDLRAHKYTTIACAEVKEGLIPWRSASDEQIAAELLKQQSTESEARHAELALADPTHFVKKDKEE